MEIKEIPRGQLSTIILSTLLDGDKYGYEIIKDIETKSDGKIKIKQPSLYSSLTRMENQKLISSYWRDSDIGGKRHYYRLTDFGRKQTEQWQSDFANSHSIVSSLFKEGENNENFILKDENQAPKFLQQENLFKPQEKIEDKKSEKKQEDTSLPDQINIFEIPINNSSIIEQPVEITEEILPPPEKQYNVYKDLNLLREKQNISSFANNQISNVKDINEQFSKNENKSYFESIKSDNIENSDINIENKQNLESFDVNTKIEEKSNYVEDDNFKKDAIENEYNTINFNNNNETNIPKTLDVENKQEKNEYSNGIFIPKNIGIVNENELVDKQQDNAIPLTQELPEIKDEGIFITETPDPDSLPKVKKIQPARFNIIGESPLFKFSPAENKYNELVEDLYKKGFNDKSSEGYLSYNTLEDYYKKQNLKFYPYKAKEISINKSSKVEKISNEFIPINKVNFYKSIIYLTLILFETWVTYAILSLVGANPNHIFLYIIVSLIFVGISIYMGILMYKNPNKELPKYNIDKKQFFINLGITLLGILLIFSFNMLFGFNGQNFVDYSTTIILPIVLLLNIPLATYINYIINKRF